MRALGLFLFFACFSFASAQAVKRVEDGSLNALLRKDVRAELKLTEEQGTKIDAELFRQSEQMMDQMRAAIEKQAIVPNKSMMTPIQRKLEVEHTAKMKALLTEAQWQRFNEVRVQLVGSNILRLLIFRETVALTKEQTLGIERLEDQEYLRSVEYYRDAFASGSSDPEGAMQFERENHEKTRKEIDKLLTAGQLEKLKTLGGAPFAAAKD